MDIRPFRPFRNASPSSALLTAPLTACMGEKRIGFSFTSIAIKSDFIHSDSYPSRKSLIIHPVHLWLMTSMDIRPFRPSRIASPVVALLTAPLTVWMGEKESVFLLHQSPLKAILFIAICIRPRKGLIIHPVDRRRMNG
ncbi:hypothetical protein CEXT_462401 [Caerostris extrusa]|uniref:Uncharacterized protein n=1 Tax=Caerostris extrusa TaxID=172846 RepID=A0AAV4WL75_CAEEX|nr:hypothetical protein CEXT_462401 [Caerostris extrusa]